MGQFLSSLRKVEVNFLCDRQNETKVNLTRHQFNQRRSVANFFRSGAIQFKIFRGSFSRASPQSQQLQLIDTISGSSTTTTTAPLHPGRAANQFEKAKNDNFNDFLRFQLIPFIINLSIFLVVLLLLLYYTASELLPAA